MPLDNVCQKMKNIIIIINFKIDIFFTQLVQCGQAIKPPTAVLIPILFHRNMEHRDHPYLLICILDFRFNDIADGREIIVEIRDCLEVA